MDLSITGEQTDGSLPTHQATRRRAFWWVTAVLLAGIIAIVLPIQKIRMLGLQLGGTIGSYTTNPPPAPQFAAISPGGSSLTVTWSQVPAATSYSIYRSDKTYNGHPFPIGSGNSTSSGNYTDQSATSGGPYTYWVTASNGGGEGPGSPSVSATINTPTPPAPAHGKLIVSGGSIQAYFSTVSGASSYNAYRDGWLMQTGVTSPYTDGGVPVGASHWYTFGAVNSNGQGSMGPYYLSATGGATPPLTANLAATAGGTSVQLSWNVVTDTNGGSISYNLYRSSSAGGEGDIPVQNWISSNNSGPMSYTDTGLSPGTTYYYKVAAVSYTGGEGTLSNEASATPLTPLLPAPNLSGAPGDGSASLTWTTVAGASSYNVYRNSEYAPLRTSDNGKVPLVKVGASGTTYTDSGLTNGAWYYYTVYAVSKDGEGVGSQSVSVVPGSVSPTLAAHIVWTSDYTVTPNVQTGSTSGTVAGNSSVHLSLQIPPNFTSGKANVTIHEDAGDIPDVVTPNVVFTAANYSNNYSGWSAVCGDPDATKANAPPMAYGDISWYAGAHNGKYTITISGQATIGNSFTPVPVTSTIHVDREDLVIAGNTPDDGKPIVYKGADSSGNPSGPVALSMSVVSASKMLITATVTIYDLDQNVIATLGPTTPDPSNPNSVVVGGGQGSTGTTINYSWDGCYAHTGSQIPVTVPDGLYYYECNVASPSSAGNLTDSNISDSLMVTVPSTEATLISDDGTNATYSTSYTLSDTNNDPASSGQMLGYDTDLNLSATQDLSQLNPSGLTLGSHTSFMQMASATKSGKTKLPVLLRDKGTKHRAGRKRAVRPKTRTVTQFAVVMFVHGDLNNGAYIGPSAPLLSDFIRPKLTKDFGYFQLPNVAAVNVDPMTAQAIKDAFNPKLNKSAHIKIAIFLGHGSDNTGQIYLKGPKDAPINDRSLTILNFQKADFPTVVYPAQLVSSPADLVMTLGCSQDNSAIANAFFNSGAAHAVISAGAKNEIIGSFATFLAGDRPMAGVKLPKGTYVSKGPGVLAYLRLGDSVKTACAKAQRDTQNSLDEVRHLLDGLPQGRATTFPAHSLGNDDIVLHQ